MPVLCVIDRKQLVSGSPTSSPIVSVSAHSTGCPPNRPAGGGVSLAKAPVGVT